MCHSPGIGVPRTSSTTSAPRSSSSRTVCATASVTPRPAATCASAAAMFGNVRERCGAIAWRARNAPVSVDGSLPAGPSSHGVPTSAAGETACDPASACPRRRDDDERVAQERLGLDRRRLVARRSRAERHVGVAARQQVRELVAARDVHLDLDARVPAHEGVEQRLGRELGDALRRGDAQRRLRAAGVAHRALARRRRARGSRPAAVARRRPTGRQHERAATAHVEVVAELAAQCSNRARNRGLRHRELLRCGLDGA